MKSALICLLVAGTSAYYLCRTASTPFPANILPPPQVIKIEIPEKAFVFADEAVGLSPRDWSGKSVNIISTDWWYEKAKDNDPLISPLMIFSRDGHVDLVLLFQTDGGSLGSSTLAISRDVSVHGFVQWPDLIRSARWHIFTRTIEVDRVTGIVTYYPEGEAGEGAIPMLFLGIILWLVCLFAAAFVISEIVLRSSVKVNH